MQKFLFRVFLLSILTFLFSACEKPSATQSISDFEKLCNIYGEFVHDSRPENVKLASPAERIEKEIPKVYLNFKNMALMDRSERYKMYKKLAESETNKAWDCKIMEKYFAGEFDSKR